VTDIAERLRKAAERSPHLQPLEAEAADEIDRLNAEIETADGLIEALEQENKRLRAALQDACRA
jgi:hypothetical protein